MPKRLSNPSNENSDRREIRRNINTLIRPIRENEIQLNKFSKNFLSEKQHNKWLKFQDKNKKSLHPKRPTRPNTSNSERRKDKRLRRQ